MKQKRRYTVDQAICHPFFTKFKDIVSELPASEKIFECGYIEY